MVQDWEAFDWRAYEAQLNRVPQLRIAETWVTLMDRRGYRRFVAQGGDIGAEFQQEEFGYIALQSTRPGLVGAMLTDSPVAQLAWQLDKFRAWTHPVESTPEDVVGSDFLLGNASLYWFTATAGSAAFVGYAQTGGWGETPENSGCRPR